MASDFDELGWFRRIASSGCRALLIGRRALVVLGLPVLTADYDFWIHTDDASAFNAAAEPFGLLPSRTPEEAPRAARYILQNGETADVLVARSMPTVDGAKVVFEEVWARRSLVDFEPGTVIALPTIDDLILTKRVAARPKDLEDIRLLEILRSRDRS